MRRVIAIAAGAAAALSSSLAVAGVAPARSIPLRGAITGGPVLAAGGAVVAQEAGRGNAFAARIVLAPDRVLASFGGFVDDDSDLGYVQGASVGGLAATGDRVAFTVVAYDTAKAKYTGNGVVSSRTMLVAGTAAPATLATCGEEPIRAAVALGEGFVVQRACTTPPSILGASPPAAPVAIGGTTVGTGTTVAAAGRFAAWQQDGATVAVFDTAAGAVVGHAPAGAEWALDETGTVYTASGAPATLSATPPGGTPAAVAEEPGGIVGLRAANGTVAYATSGTAGERRIVVRRGAQRRELARIWPASPATVTAPFAVATDGARVAWLEGGCDGTLLTVVALADPDRPAAPAACPLTLARSGRIDARRVAVPVRCGPNAPAPACTGTGTLVVRAGGRVLARRSLRVTPTMTATAPLTPAGRRAARGATRLRAAVELTRLIDGRRIVAKAVVRLSRG